MCFLCRSALMSKKTKELHDHTPKPPKAGVVHLNFLEESQSLRTEEARQAEAENLFHALGVDVAWSQSINISKIEPPTILGKGKVKELAEVFEQEELEAVFVNTSLSPSQQRNLEKAWQIKVIDRTGVILEIFADRARTKAGRLQVELAQVMYQQSRLVRAWTHLERQRGGLGKTGGPGERQLELDKRMLRDRATSLRRKLEHIKQERDVQRGARKKNQYAHIALVGYTNAGKSTLFKTLTGQEAGAKDMLFATLDPLTRSWQLQIASKRKVMLSDTVGFISDLPHELVESFQATLEEVVAADVLMIVHDASSPEQEAQAEDVTEVLKQIGAEDIPVIHVFNKVDTLVSAEKQQIFAQQGICISALTGEGTAELEEAVEKYLTQSEEERSLTLPASDGQALAWLYAQGDVLESIAEEAYITVRVRLKKELWQRFSHNAL